MNKVITINLNGRAYQLEEAGYDALSKYLAQASGKLHGNPDCDEIMADFEQAIAEKCDQHLTAHKTVVSEKEIKEIITAMGPVEESESKESAHKESKNIQPRRLYAIKEGAVIGGVCRGIAAYLNIDVTIVRLAFILLTIFTGGVWILVYIVLMLVMPEARTPEEKAEAHGYAFNAQELIDRAKTKYAELSDENHWRRVARENEAVANKVASVAKQLGIFVAKALGLILTIASGLLAAVWSLSMWTFVWRDSAVGFGKEEPLLMLAWLASVFLAVFIPMTLVSKAFLENRGKNVKKSSTVGTVVGCVLWIAALATLLTISLNYRHRIIDTINHNQEYIQIRNGQLCVGNTKTCKPHL